MKIKNIKFNPKLLAVILSGGILTTSLMTSCGPSISVESKSNHSKLGNSTEFYNKALIFEDERVTIVDIKSWCEYNFGAYRIQTQDDFWFTSPIYNTRLIDETVSELSAEDFARTIKGDDVEIVYFEEGYQKVK